MKHLPIFLLTAAIAALSCVRLAAVEAASSPQGVMLRELPQGKDTPLSIPFTRQSVFEGTVASVAGDTVNFNVGEGPTPDWTPDEFAYAEGAQSDTYYLFFRSGQMEGHWYTITGNGSSSVTVDLAGESLDTVAVNDRVGIIPFWTLGTLLPDSEEGQSFIATTNPFARETEILVFRPGEPGIASGGEPTLEAGRNKAPEVTYFYFDGEWRRVGASTSLSFSDDVILPDSFVLVRNNLTATQMILQGHVLPQNFSIILTTSTFTDTDNIVSIPRPVAVTLDESGLVPEDPEGQPIDGGPFQVTTNPFNRADEILVYFDIDSETKAITEATGKNVAPSSTYFYYNGAWRKVGESLSVDFGSDPVFQEGNGVVIRKNTTGDGASETWVNSPTYIIE